MSNSQRGHVLVVDEDPVSVRTLAAMLSKDGFEVATASDGKEALDQIQQSPPDALVAGDGLPCPNGSKLLGMVCKYFPEILVVAVGAHRVASSLLQEGALACLSEPVQADEIVSVLDAGMQLREERLSWPGVYG
jgi:two-component system response regulator AtoC